MPTRKTIWTKWVGLTFCAAMAGLWLVCPYLALGYQRVTEGRTVRVYSVFVHQGVINLTAVQYTPEMLATFAAVFGCLSGPNGCRIAAIQPFAPRALVPRFVTWTREEWGGTLLVPMWAVLILAAIPTLRAMRATHRRVGECDCGYSLRGNPSGPCPECGVQMPTSTSRWQIWVMFWIGLLACAAMLFGWWSSTRSRLVVDIDHMRLVLVDGTLEIYRYSPPQRLVGRDGVSVVLEEITEPRLAGLRLWPLLVIAAVIATCALLARYLRVARVDARGDHLYPHVAQNRGRREHSLRESP